jgi:hypothetical protein
LDALAHLVADVQNKFQEMLGKASAVTAHIDRARATAEATAHSVPDIVARIEATDASKALQAIGQLSKRVEAMQGSLEAQAKILSAIKDKKGFFFSGFRG